MAGCQRHLIYLPTRMAATEAEALARQDGLVPWRDASGAIIGWRWEGAAPSGDAMLLFHGNAGFAAQRGYFAYGFAPHFATYLFEYPGYGARGGSPAEETIAKAAEAALAQLRQERPGARLYLGGESLGTGVACRLAGDRPEWVSGVFLATPFTSLADVAKVHHPLLPTGLFLRDRYESALHLRSYGGPAAFLVAGRDEVVPARLGRALFDGYGGPKRIWMQEDRSHNTVDSAAGRAWWSEVADFLKSAAQ